MTDRSPMEDWPIVATVQSQSRPDVTHLVRRSPGGTLWCGCESFFYSTVGNKRCQHTDVQVALEERQAIQEEG